MKRHRKEKLKRFLGQIAVVLIAFLCFVAFITLILFFAVPCSILAVIQYLNDKLRHKDVQKRHGIITR